MSPVNWWALGSWCYLLVRQHVLYVPNSGQILLNGGLRVHSHIVLFYQRVLISLTQNLYKMLSIGGFGFLDSNLFSSNRILFSMSLPQNLYKKRSVGWLVILLLPSCPSTFFLCSSLWICMSVGRHSVCEAAILLCQRVLHSITQNLYTVIGRLGVLQAIVLIGQHVLYVANLEFIQVAFDWWTCMGYPELLDLSHL